MSTVEKKDEEVEQLPTEIPSSNKNDVVFNKELFDANALSILGSVFNTSCQDNFNIEACTKSVSIKLMITLQDEADLKALGYSKKQIDQLKPQEADDIIQAGTKAEPIEEQE